MPICLFPQGKMDNKKKKEQAKPQKTSALEVGSSFEMRDSSQQLEGCGRNL